MLLVSVDYDATGRGVNFDPTLHWTAPWADRPLHDAAGALAGWERMTAAGETLTLPAEPRVHTLDRSDPRRPVLAPDPG